MSEGAWSLPSPARYRTLMATSQLVTPPSPSLETVSANASSFLAPNTYHDLIERVAHQEAALTSLHAFLTTFLDYPLEPTHHALCDFIETSGAKQLVLMPRFSWKSSCLTIGYSVYRLLKNPNMRILIDSELLKNSKRFIAAIERYFESHEGLRALFGDLVPSKDEAKWNDTEMTLKSRTSFAKEASVTVAGLDVDLTSAHFNLIICDDLVSSNNTNTKEQLEKVKEHFQLLHSLLDPSASQLIVIGTRWHFADLYHTILTEMPQYQTFIRQALTDASVAKLPSHRWAVRGTPVFPRLLPRAFLEEQLNLQGLAIWNAQYQNQAQDSEFAKFKWASIKAYTTVPEGLYITTTIDPAISKEETADESAILTVGTDPSGVWYVLDVRHGRWNPYELVAEVFAVVQAFDPTVVGLEKHGFQQTLEYFLKEEMDKQNLYFAIEPLLVDSRISKDRRIEGLVPLFESGRIFLKDVEDALAWQLKQYPKCAHDDLVDALSHQLQLVAHGTAPVAVREDEAYATVPWTHAWYDHLEEEIERRFGANASAAQIVQVSNG